MKKIVISKDIAPDQLNKTRQTLMEVYKEVELWEYEGSFITIPAADTFIAKYVSRYEEVEMFFGSEKDCNLPSIKGIKKDFKNVEEIIFIVSKDFDPPKEVYVNGVQVTDNFQIDRAAKKGDIPSQSKNEEKKKKDVKQTTPDQTTPDPPAPVVEEEKSASPNRPSVEGKRPEEKKVEPKEVAIEEKAIEVKDEVKDSAKSIPPSADQLVKRKKQLEEKVIEYREYINIPVWKKNRLKQKSIGVWSPLQRVGVSTFINNLCFYLAQYPIDIAVLESLSNKVKMKSLLSRYCALPGQWASYCSFINGAAKAEQVRLNFNSVDFYPLSESDVEINWDPILMNYYMEGLKFYDIVLVDLPTGEMSSFTEEALSNLDEVWVIINNDIMELIEWKSYINTTLKDMDVKLIFNNYIDCSEPEVIANALGYPLITTIPTLHEEAIRNQYLKEPLFFQENVAEKLKKPFKNILDYLAENQTLNKKEPEIRSRFNPSRFMLWKK